MKLKKIILFLVATTVVLGMSFTLVEAAEVTVGGSINIRGGLLSTGGRPEQGKSSIWNKPIYDTNLGLTHVHPTLSIDVTEKVSGDVLICFSEYHQTQVWIASMDYTPYVSEGFGDNPITIRAGRFMVPFGYLNEAGSHPVNLKTITRPLLYVSHDQEDFGLKGGPRPPIMTPFFDTGVLLFGDKYLRGEKDQLWYGVYMVAGMFHHINNYNSPGKDLELDWEDYHIERMGDKDSNNNKAIGARITYSVGDILTLGGSYSAGKYDPESKLDYSLIGGDLRIMVGKANLQFEYAQNPSEWIQASGAEVASIDIYTLGTKKKYTKKGWYTQLDFPFDLLFADSAAAKKFEFVTTYSVIEGTKEKSAGNMQTFDKQSQITAGFNFIPDPDAGLIYKVEYQSIMFASYNNTAANIATYGTGFDDFSRINFSAGLSF